MSVERWNILKIIPPHIPPLIMVPFHPHSTSQKPLTSNIPPRSTSFHLQIPPRSTSSTPPIYRGWSGTGRTGGRKQRQPSILPARKKNGPMPMTLGGTCLPTINADLRARNYVPQLELPACAHVLTNTMIEDIHTLPHEGMCTSRLLDHGIIARRAGQEFLFTWLYQPERQVRIQAEAYARRHGLQLRINHPEDNLWCYNATSVRYWV